MSLNSSVIRIMSNDPEVKELGGTGFVIHRDEQATYIVTCAHVVKTTGLNTTIISNIQATVFRINEDIDLAILLLKGLEDIQLLNLSTLSMPGDSFDTAGFQKYDKTNLIRPLEGVLGEEVGTEGRSQSDRTKAWDLKITSDYQLDKGYSGAPVRVNGNVVAVVSMMEGEGKKGIAISIEELKKIWPDMPPSIFKHESTSDFINHYLKKRNQKLLSALASIVEDAKIQEADVKKIYNESVPENVLMPNTWYLREDDRPLVRRVLESLNDVTTADSDIPPLLTFIERLAEHTGDRHGKFRRWVDDFGRPNWNVSNEKLKVLRQKLQEEKNRGQERSEEVIPSLLIKLERRRSKLLSFRVKAWLRYGLGEDEIEALPLSSKSNVFEKSYTPDTVGKLFDLFLDDIVESPNIESRAKEKLRIEFFLPFELLGLDVDKWKFNKGRVKLGARHPVVIRLAERLTESKYNKELWMRKWNNVSQHTIGERAVHWICSLEDCEGADNSLVPSSIVCLCMTLMPPFLAPPQNKPSKELFEHIITTGTAIVLWLRKTPDDSPMMKQTFKLLLLTDKKLSELPEVVLQHRQIHPKHAVYNDVAFLGENLTLLWDDPTRLPPIEDQLSETRMRIS